MLIWETQADSPPVVIQTKKLNAMGLLAFDPAGTHLALASGSYNTALLYNIKTGEQCGRVTGHTEGLLALVFSPDGKRLATSSYDNTVRIWDAETGTPGPVLRHDAFVDHLSFNPDRPAWPQPAAAEWAGLGGEERETDRSAFEDGRCRALPEIQPRWQAAPLGGDGRRCGSGMRKRPSPSRSCRASSYPCIAWPSVLTASTSSRAGSDTSVYIWDIETGKTLAVLPHGNSVWNVAYSSDGALVVTTSSDNLAKVWDAKTGKLLSVMGKVLAAVKNLAFSADVKSIITAHVDGKVATWEVQTGRLTAITWIG